MYLNAGRMYSNMLDLSRDEDPTFFFRQKNADPGPAGKKNADPDPAGKNADPDPTLTRNGEKNIFLSQKKFLSFWTVIILLILLSLKTLIQ